MKNLFFTFGVLIPLLAYAKSANQVYVMPASGNIPGWGQLDLSQSAAVKNQLSVPNGGTGLASLSMNALITGAGTGTPSSVGVGTSGYVLTSNGKIWLPQPAPSGGGGSGNIVGAGASGYLSRWTGSASLSNSSLYDTGTQVGLGTSSPLFPLDIKYGDVAVETGSVGVGLGTSSPLLSLDIGGGILARPIAQPSPSPSASVGVMYYDSAVGQWEFSNNGGAAYTALGAAAFQNAPSVSVFTTGSGFYITPSNPSPLYLVVTMVGGGGGGGAAGTNNGQAGGNTTFGSLTASGGQGGPYGTNGPGGAGGAASAVSTGISVSGGWGSSGTGQSVGQNGGGSGGSSPLGGAGAGGSNGQAGFNASANSGSGGGGGAGTATNNVGNGGGAGGYIHTILPSPSPSYSYSVGSGGSGGAAGAFAGGNGGSGIVVVEAFYAQGGSNISSSDSAAVFHHEFTQFAGSPNFGSLCTSGVCSVFNGTTGIATVSHVSTGTYNAVFLSGVCNTIPSCSVTPDSSGSAASALETYSSSSSTNVSFQMVTSAGALTNSAGYLDCKCPHN